MNKQFQIVKIRIGNSADVFHICKDTDNNGYWGISDSYVTDGKINDSINGISGNFSRSYTDCIKNCFWKVWGKETKGLYYQNFDAYCKAYTNADEILESKGISDNLQNVKEIIL